jgi:uncharacterized protein (TIGR02466 family)
MAAKVEGVFPIPIYVSAYENHKELKNELLRIIDENEANRTQEIYQNDRSKKTYHIVNDFFDTSRNARFLEFKQWLYSGISDYWSNVLGKYECEMVVTDYWFNISQKDGYQHLHDHCNAAISGTYYINFNDSTHSRFHVATPHAQTTSFEPILLTETVKITDWNKQTVEVRHAEGDLVLFPSWLRHGYPPNPADGRISLSFNVLPKIISSRLYKFEINNLGPGIERS